MEGTGLGELQNSSQLGHEDEGAVIFFLYCFFLNYQSNTVGANVESTACRECREVGGADVGGLDPEGVWWADTKSGLIPIKWRSEAVTVEKRREGV